MATFAAGLPAWCGPDGFPLSWRHYQYGLAYLARAHVRAEIAAAEAYRVAQYSQEDYNAWHRDMSAMVGPGKDISLDG